MSSNPANQPIEEQFLRWCQEIEAKQEEQARQMAELREHVNHLQQENEGLRAHLETNGVEIPQGTAQPVPLTRKIRANGPPYLTIVISQHMTSSLQTALYFPIIHHPRTMRKPNSERDLLASPAGLLVVHAVVYEERPAGTGPVRN